jgi:hypothetical protein
MKTFRLVGFSRGLLGIAVIAAFSAGCGHSHDHDHNHDRDKHGTHDQVGHEHADGMTSGASFQPGKGVVLAEETRKSIGVGTAEVAERKLPNQVVLTLQVFGEKHRHQLNVDDHTSCDTHGSGFLSSNGAANVKPGQPVQLFKNTNQPLHGVVRAVQKALALGEIEIVVGVSNALTALKPGEFVPARITMPRATAVPAIPESALLRTAEGTFAYKVNGDAYLRRPVKTGAEAEGWIEISEGLAPGDRVVTTPVQTLWLIELRAVKGGGHSH